MTQKSGQLIILNGTSSAGKSSIAKALQEKLGGDFLHVEMDTFLNRLPPMKDLRWQEVINEGLNDIADFVAKRLECGANVILDIVAWKKDIALYKKHAPYLVAIKPSLDVLRAREKARGDRCIGLAESQFPTIHEGISYDLEIDNSSLTAEQIANKIIKAFAETRFVTLKPRRLKMSTEALLPKNEKA